MQKKFIHDLPTERKYTVLPQQRPKEHWLLAGVLSNLTTKIYTRSSQRKLYP